MRSVWALAVAGLMVLAVHGPADAQNATGIPIAAVWKEQHMNFFYLGRTSRYSCQGLRDKVRALLLDLGARRDIRITALGCDDADVRGRPRASSPSLTIVVSTPALPDASAKPLHPGDLAPVDARFENFTIASDAFRNMGIADCELVEEFARQILPRLVTRNLRQDITCVPFQQSGSRFLVRGEILRTLAPR
ncbi:MAG: hypothetical protein WBF89_09730 [Steroidobacteraceae bacterium]